MDRLLSHARVSCLRSVDGRASAGCELTLGFFMYSDKGVWADRTSDLLYYINKDVLIRPGENWNLTPVDIPKKDKS